MNTFPTLSSSPNIKGFVEELSDEAVRIASTASGYPVLNKLFTFDPRTWKFALYCVSQTDKSAVITFYEANKDVPFNWKNGQDGETYEVIFMSKPACQLEDCKDLWLINLILRQNSPLP